MFSPKSSKGGESPANKLVLICVIWFSSRIDNVSELNLFCGGINTRGFSLKIDSRISMDSFRLLFCSI